MRIVLTSDVVARIANPLQADSGQGLVEYSLLMGFIVVVCVAALMLFGSDVSNALSNIANGL